MDELELIAERHAISPENLLALAHWAALLADYGLNAQDIVNATASQYEQYAKFIRAAWEKSQSIAEAK